MKFWNLSYFYQEPNAIDFSDVDEDRLSSTYMWPKYPAVLPPKELCYCYYMITLIFNIPV